MSYFIYTYRNLTAEDLEFVADRESREIILTLGV